LYIVGRWLIDVLVGWDGSELIRWWVLVRAVERLVGIRNVGILIVIHDCIIRIEMDLITKLNKKNTSESLFYYSSIFLSE
jgi:hypothetical protein